MIEKLKTIDRNLVVVMIGVLLLVIGFAFSRTDTEVAENQEVAVAQETTEETAEETVEDNVEPADTAEAENYTYIAQPGDSYTKMVRKAVQTYGIVNGVDLSSAEIVYAETTLTREAGAPMLEVGQEVVIEQSAVQQVVDKAGQLSEEAEALWATYVPHVDFNTNSVGEATSV